MKNNKILLIIKLKNIYKIEKLKLNKFYKERIFMKMNNKIK